jgi:hypothetical protein
MRGKNSKSLANLKPAKKGEVRNPRGTNKRPFADLYFALSEEIIPEWKRRQLNKLAGGALHPRGTTWAEADARALHDKASQGDVSAIKELADRTEGRSPERPELTDPTKQVVTIHIVDDRRKNPSQ